MKKIFALVLSTMFCLPVCRAELDNYKKAQLGICALKTAIQLYTDTISPVNVQLNVQQAKRVAMLRLFARGLNGAAKGLDYKNGIRDGVSLGTHLNASVWQGIKDLEELKTLARLEGEHDEEVPVSVLKKYYSGLKETSEEIDEFDLDAGEGPSLKTIMKPLLRLAELGLAAGLTWQIGTPKQKNLMMLGQAICDGLLRFVCNEKGFMSPSLIGKIEAVSSLAPCAYDAGNSVYNYLIPDPVDPGPAPSPDPDPQGTNPPPGPGGGDNPGDDNIPDEEKCEICYAGVKQFAFPCCLYRVCNGCVQGIGKRGINVGTGWKDYQGVQDCVQCPTCRCCCKEQGNSFRVFKQSAGSRNFYEEIGQQ